MPDYGVSPYGFGPGRQQPVNVPRDTFYGDTDDRTDQDVATFSALVSHHFGDDFALRNEIQSNHVHVDARETASQSLGIPGTGTGFTSGFRPAVATDPLASLYVKLQSHDRVITDHSVFDQLDLTARADTGPVHHEVITGAEIGHDTYSNQSLSRTGRCNGVILATGYVGCESLVAPVYAESPAGLPEVKGNLSLSQANSYGVYVNDTLGLGPRFKLVGGVRRDWFDARIANTITLPRTIVQDVAYTSVRAGGIWQPTLAQSYYVSYSTSFNPSLEQLTNTTGTTTPLPPETNQAWEAGAKFDVLTGKLSLDGAVFQITQDNARSADASGVYTATGTIRVRGARMGGSGLLARGWKVFAGYAFLDAKIIDGVGVATTGMVPANTPRHSGTLWTTCEVLPHWDIGGGAVYQSRRFASNTDAVQVGGYARWDGTIAYHQPKYDVRLNAFNLFDKKYFDALIPSDGGRSVPGTGRSAMLSFSYHL
jgi:catecholate siderophore receptor